MDKFVFGQITAYQEIPMIVAQNFGLKEKNVQAALQERKQKGSVSIEQDIELSHVELSGLRVQGIMWLPTYHKKYLVMVVDTQNPSINLVIFLKAILNKEGLNKLRLIHSQKQLDQLVEGTLQYVNR